MDLHRLGPWPARALWLLAAPVVGWGVSRALDQAPDTPGLLVEIALWAAWFAVLIATLAPSPIGLTICRIAAPATVGVAVLAGWLGPRWDGPIILAIGFAAVVTAVFFLPTFGDHMINGSAYGSERRMALRPQAFTLIGPVQLAWSIVFVGLVTAPLLVLAERYVLAAVAAVVGVGAVWAGGRILHQLARRWIVFVPAGFVLRDPMQLVDAVLLRRNLIEALGPALAEPDGSETIDRSDAIDLSGGALGLALRVTSTEPTTITVWRNRNAELQNVSDLVFTPSLPGAALSEARIRGIKIGEAAPH